MEMGWWGNVLDSEKWCANCVCLWRGPQSHWESDMTSDLVGHTHCWSPACKCCSVNIPGVSLVLPNQFLGHRMSTCSSVHVSWCPTGTCQHLRWHLWAAQRLLTAPGCSRPSQPAGQPGMGPLSPFLPCKLLLIFQSPKFVLREAPGVLLNSTDSSRTQGPVGEGSTPHTQPVVHLLGRRSLTPPPLPTSAPWALLGSIMSYAPQGPQVLPQWLARAQYSAKSASSVTLSCGMNASKVLPVSDLQLLVGPVCV